MQWKERYAVIIWEKSSVLKVDPCGICGDRVACNSIKCTKCQRWVHCCFFDVPKWLSLLSCQDVFICRTCLGYNCSVRKKLEFKRGEDVLEEVKRFCYLGVMISCYCGASDTVSARISSAWKKFRELVGVLVRKQGLSLKQQGKTYQCCVRPILLYYCKTGEPTVAEEERLRGVERCIIRMMCGVRLVDRVSPDVLQDMLGVVVKIEDMIMQGHVVFQDINS